MNRREFLKTTTCTSIFPTIEMTKRHEREQKKEIKPGQVWYYGKSIDEDRNAISRKVVLQSTHHFALTKRRYTEQEKTAWTNLDRTKDWWKCTLFWIVRHFDAKTEKEGAECRFEGGGELPMLPIEDSAVYVADFDLFSILKKPFDLVVSPTYKTGYKTFDKEQTSIPNKLDTFESLTKLKNNWKRILEMCPPRIENGMVCTVSFDARKLHMLGITLDDLFGSIYT